MYELVIPDAVGKDVKRLDNSIQKALRETHFPRLKENPRCGEMLRGSLECGVIIFDLVERSIGSRMRFWKTSKLFFC